MSDTTSTKTPKTAAAQHETKGTVDAKELAHFAEHGKDMWKEGHPLQLMNQLRVPAIVDALLPPTETNRVLRDGPLPLRGFRILDVGCGGGFLAEPLAKLGAEVVGLDFVQESIDIAEAHAKKDTELAESGRLHYVCATIEEYYKKVGGGPPNSSETTGSGNIQIPQVPPAAAFDLVVASEMVEHVADFPLIIRYIVALVRPGGAVYITTINRTWLAYIVMIVLGEYVLRLVPRGTHHYEKLVPPEELRIQLEQNGCAVEEVRGMAYNPFAKQWRWTESSAISYGLRARKSRTPSDRV